jgi:CubicO group peptidase (beta-lactamase class C family)
MQVEQRVPSTAAAVFRGSELVWTGAVGFADVESGEEVTADHQYRIGSITKTFTAAAIMRLRDEGRLDLEDPLGEHLPDTPHAKLPLRRMLSHLSGLQREFPGDVWESLELPERDELFARLGETEQVLAPGVGFHYSNLAFALLGEVVALRSQTPYSDHVRETFLEPLGMTRTTWHGEPPVAKGYLVEPYADRVQPEGFDVDLRSSTSAGGLWSTVGDLCKWGAFLCSPDEDVLSAASVEEMHGFQAMADLETWTYGFGLGLMLFRRGERLLAGHNGGMPGHATFLNYSRKEQIGSAHFLATTSPSPEASALGFELSVKAVEALGAEPPPWRPDADAPPEELEGVLGRWWAEGSEVVLSYREGKLRAKYPSVPGERGVAIFEREAPDRYRVASGVERGELLRVVRDGEGNVEKLYWATYPFTREPRAFGN